MTKHHGLSQLADVARELTQPGNAHYPIRQRGEERRLNPNWTGIAWLEASALEATAIIREEGMGDPDDGLYRSIPDGRYNEGNNGYIRPMFEILPATSSGAPRSDSQVSCPHCGDLAYTTRCKEHTPQEEALPLGVIDVHGCHILRDFDISNLNFEYGRITITPGWGRDAF